MAQSSYPAHIDLRFGNAAREFLDFLTGVRSGNLARERRNFFRKHRVGKNGHGKPVAELIPVAARDTAAIARAIAEVRAVRQRLARRGMRPRDVLGKSKTWRDLAHEGHRY